MKICSGMTCIISLIEIRQGVHELVGRNIHTYVELCPP
jgi:hypothetical protein